MKKKIKLSAFAIAGLIFLALLCLLILFVYIDCTGNVSSAKTIEVGSEIYTSSEINGTIDIVKENFHDDFEGCKLLEIYYAGDEKLRYYTDYDKDGSADVLVLMSKYYVYPFGGDGSLSTNSVYDNWNRILTRENGGGWELVTWGY